MAPLTIIDAKFCMMGAVEEKLPKKISSANSSTQSLFHTDAPNAALGQLVIHGYSGGDDGGGDDDGGDFYEEDAVNERDDPFPFLHPVSSKGCCLRLRGSLSRSLGLA